jgi:hypothetical protein
MSLTFVVATVSKFEHEKNMGMPMNPQEVLSLSPNLKAIPSRMLYIESILARLRAAGFSPSAASRGYHAIDSHILGFTLWELGHRMPGDSSGELLETFIRQFDYPSFPFLGEHLLEHMKEPDSEEIGDFEFGLDLILDGIGAMSRAIPSRLLGTN